MKLSRETLQGVWPALLIPWTDDQVDYDRLRCEVRAYADTGVSGVYTGGTTGEFYAQDDASFARIAKLVCEEGHSLGLPVQIGCTALSTRIVCQRINVAKDAKADGVQIALPFWLELKDDEVRSFFSKVVAAAGELPIVLYQTARAKRRLTIPLISELAAQHSTFIGLKDTTISPEELSSLLSVAPSLAVFGGDHDLLEKVQAGGRGTYSSVALLNAPFLVRLFRLADRGDLVGATPMQVLVRAYYTEVLMPMATAGLMDSAIDRVQRIAGGVDIGLNCQGPYRAATELQIDQLLSWCRCHAPALLSEPASPINRATKPEVPTWL